MLMSYLPSPLTPGSEQGVTLIELLVAMVIGLVVTGALLLILEFSLNQETRISDKVQADTIGRTAMTKVIDKLHSSCTGFGNGGVQIPTGTVSSPLEVTGPSNLWFITAYGSKTAGAAVIEDGTLHDVSWTATRLSNTGQHLGTLTDHSFAATSGNAKEGWQFPATLSVATATSSTRLATDVVAPQISGASTLFQYYRYEATGTKKGELTALISTEFPLTATTDGEVAKVVVSFTQAPEGGDTRVDRTANVSDAVLLRFEPTETTSEASNEVCS
jgi:prepilin-type N-terminal cleavage/methylation domain-containing protein